LFGVAKVLAFSRAEAEKVFVGKLTDNYISKSAADIRIDCQIYLSTTGTRFFGAGTPTMRRVPKLSLASFSDLPTDKTGKPTYQEPARAKAAPRIRIAI
jgi:hypothetical protein